MDTELVPNCISLQPSCHYENFKCNKCHYEKLKCNKCHYENLKCNKALISNKTRCDQ
jgi:hypothetical protein